MTHTVEHKHLRCIHGYDCFSDCIGCQSIPDHIAQDQYSATGFVGLTAQMSSQPDSGELALGVGLQEHISKPGDSKCGCTMVGHSHGSITVDHDKDCAVIELHLVRSHLLRIFGSVGDAMTNVQMVEKLAEDHRELMRLTRPNIATFCCNG